VDQGVLISPLLLAGIAACPGRSPVEKRDLSVSQVVLVVRAPLSVVVGPPETTCKQGLSGFTPGTHSHHPPVARAVIFPPS
jgi:hypothetical protein